MTPQTLLKLLGGVVATVLLGAIGSGLWERVLAPVFDGFFRVSVDLLSSFSSNYKNGIYKAASQGFHEDYSLRVFALGILLVSLWALLFVTRWNEHLGRATSLIVSEYKGALQWVVMVAALSFSLATFYSVSRHDAINKTATYALRSMDVLRPHIGDQKYQLLLSQFYQIRSAEQFQVLNSTLVEQARSFNVRLPEFTPL